MINNSIKAILESREFVSVATSDLEAMPNAAPKFLLKVEGDHIYLVDYIIGRTFLNLQVNPRVSLSLLDSGSLMGYQINGRVEIIDSGREYATVLKELQDKQIDLSVKRVIEGVSKGRAHKAYELSIPEQFVILKVRAEEIVHIQPSGALKREKV